jgi:hypothetical protein
MSKVPRPFRLGKPKRNALRSYKDVPTAGISISNFLMNILDLIPPVFGDILPGYIVSINKQLDEVI